MGKEKSNLPRFADPVSLEGVCVCVCVCVGGVLMNNCEVHNQKL